MSTNLKVSIVINNYNYALFLRKAIDSALLQIYSDIEVVVVDDGSTDESRQIIESYGDSIIPVFQENSKQGAALNNGFSHSTGDIIIFLDADDYLYPNTVEQIVGLWRADVAKVHYRLEVVDIESKPRGFSYPPKSQVLASGDLKEQVLAFGGYNGVPTSGNAISRQALAQVMPIPADFYTVSDDYLSVLIPLHGDVIAIQEPLGAYRIHNNNQWALTTVTSERFHRFIRHDLQRCELLETWGEKLNYPVPSDLYMRSFGRVWSRLASLRFDPANHPVPTDRPLVLAALGVKALYKYSVFNWQKRFVFSLWFIWVGVMPSWLAKPVIVWLFAPHLRPKVIHKLLTKLRSLTSSQTSTQPEQPQQV